MIRTVSTIIAVGLYTALSSRSFALLLEPTVLLRTTLVKNKISTVNTFTPENWKKYPLIKRLAELGLGLTRDLEVPSYMKMSIVQLILNHI